MFSDKKWAEIHERLLPSFMRVAKGAHTASGQKICFEVGGLRSDEMHALYMNCEVWDKVVKPALDAFDKANAHAGTVMG